MDWTQAATIIGSNLALFLWATRQARSDYLHIDKKFEDNRREMAQTIKTFTEQTNKILHGFDERLEKK